jgi:sec-independent protein translocase protein TatB
MEIFGIGPLEFLFIFIIAIIVLGPKGMVEAAREAGKFIRKIIRSPIWRDVVDTSREIREFPRKIAHEAGIEKDLEDLRRSTQGTMKEIRQYQIPSIQPIEKDKPFSEDSDPPQADTENLNG